MSGCGGRGNAGENRTRVRVLPDHVDGLYHADHDEAGPEEEEEAGGEVEEVGNVSLLGVRGGRSVVRPECGRRRGLFGIGGGRTQVLELR